MTFEDTYYVVKDFANNHDEDCNKFEYIKNNDIEKFLFATGNDDIIYRVRETEDPRYLAVMMYKFVPLNEDIEVDHNDEGNTLYSSVIYKVKGSEGLEEVEPITLEDLDIGKIFIYNSRRYIKMNNNYSGDNYNVAYLDRNVIPEHLYRNTLVIEIE